MSADELLDDIKTALDDCVYIPPEQPALFDDQVIPDAKTNNLETLIRLQSS